MASLQKDPSGNFHLAFQFGGSRFKRSLKTKSQRKAEAACSRVKENIALIEAGRLELPENIDLPTYLLSNGKLDHRPNVQSSLRLGQLFSTYEETVPADSMEATSLSTARLHIRKKCFPAPFPAKASFYGPPGKIRCIPVERPE